MAQTTPSTQPSDTRLQGDPRELFPKPPFPEQQQPMPGSEARMEPEPDYGMETWVGRGRLTGKAALITGADSGIGRAVALAFAREGADVLISYLSEENDARTAAAAVEQAGRNAVLMAGDIGDESHCQQLVQRATREFGKLDILVNNAAFQATHESIQEFTADEIERTFRTNIFAMFHLCKAAMRVMQPGSAIINTASIQAYEPSGELLAYATTKGAIVTFSKGLVKEALEKGIRVNVVAPGPVWTPLIPSTMPPEKSSQFGAQVPMGRPGQPVELAGAYVFLASTESTYITGEVIGVTGGKPLP